MVHEQLQRVQALGKEQPAPDVAQRPHLLHAGHEAFPEVDADGHSEFVDAAGLGAVLPEDQREVARRLVLRREAEPVRVAREAMHDVSDRQLARTAHHAVVAGSAQPHRVRTKDLLALAGADHHENLLRRVLPVRAEGAGAGAHAALHAHFHPVAVVDLFLDFAQEIVAVLVQHLLVQVAHGYANPFNGLMPISLILAA